MFFEAGQFYCPRCHNRVSDKKLACDLCIDHSKPRKKEKYVKPKPDVDSLLTDVPGIGAYVLPEAKYSTH